MKKVDSARLSDRRFTEKKVMQLREQKNSRFLVVGGSSIQTSLKRLTVASPLMTSTDVLAGSAGRALPMWVMRTALRFSLMMEG